jgi:ATP-dependent helicase HrpA
MQRPAEAPDLRARLADVTLRDEHRLRRRLDRARRTATPGLRPRRRGGRARRGAPGPPAGSVPDRLLSAGAAGQLRREDLLAAISEHQVVVVAGETGSGKTTQLPKMCLELGRGIRGTIAHTQPRRWPPARWPSGIADELHVPLGEAVGYSVRFASQAREETLLRLMTDGLLLAEIQQDRDLLPLRHDHHRRGPRALAEHRLPARLPARAAAAPARPQAPHHVGHDRSRAVRPALRRRPVVEVSGRTYPVEVRYRGEPEPADDEEADPDADGPRRLPGDPVEAIGDAVDELLDEGPDGDVLVFLSGEREIRDTADHLSGRLGPRVDILPLYARLSTPEQQRVFQAHRGRASCWPRTSPRPRSPCPGSATSSTRGRRASRATPPG